MFGFRLLFFMFFLNLVFFSPVYAAQTGGRGAELVDWTTIDSSPVLLIYSGITSWEFLKSKDHRLGARAINRGRKSCRHCHLSDDGELDMEVASIVTGALKKKRSHEYFEPEPIQGKAPTLAAKLQAAYDDTFLYIRIEWLSEGNGWKNNSVNGIPDRVSLQVNGTEPAFKRYGCFIACHSDVRSMPKSPSKKEVLANRFYKPLGRDDVRLYAFYTKDAWNLPRPKAELAKRRKAGGLIDLWTIEFHNKKTVDKDGSIFSDRLWQKKKMVEGTGSWAGAGYSAVFKRRLGKGGPNDVTIKDGSVVSIGVAIHDDATEARKHYVSFPLTIGLGVKADLKAEKIK